MKVLVLNNAYQPINVTSLSRGFKLVFKGKAEIVEHIPENPIITSQKSYKRPTVIRLLRYISVPFKKVPLTRQNLYRRDDFECVYCGDKKDLTIDHFIPKSKGGNNGWKNLVTSCQNCNVTKDNKDVEVFLEENNLTLKHKPFVPNYLYFINKYTGFHKSWKIYIGIDF
jgi:5-methylcytosine-specific restriction endonuclease McrA